MLELSPDDIRLGARLDTRDEAIRSIASLLAHRGAVPPTYVESLLGREKMANTYLGNGVAIPHGMPRDAKAVIETRVVLIQVPEGVPWKGDERAHLIFGIAASGDEHIALLARLTGITSDPDLARRLASTTDVEDIIAAVRAGGADVDAAAANDFDGERVVVRFTNPRGFHLRPATSLAEVAQQMDGDLSLVVNGKEADARSAFSIVKLGITAGSQIEIRSRSPYAADHLFRLRRLIELINVEPQETAEEDEGVEWNPGSSEHSRFLTGTMASPGIAVGPVLHWQQARAVSETRRRGDNASERDALRGAIQAAADELRSLAQDPQMNKVQRDLFKAHLGLIEDPELRRRAEAGIESGADAVTAWETAVTESAATLASVADQHLAQRAADLKDAGRRVSLILMGGGADPLQGITAPVIIVATDLEPSETARLSPEKVSGICLREGGPNAHAAIVARSLGIPMVVAMGAALNDLKNRETVVLDASGGRLLCNPSRSDLESAEEALQALNSSRRKAWNQRFSPATLRCGHRVEVVANIARATEAKEALQAGAEGVGLVRTEFLFLDRDHAPSEDEQYEAYKAMAIALEGLPMVLRTVDIGGDKPVDYLGLSQRDLSFLGLRGIRLGLARPEILRTQLRAVYRAAAHGDIRLLFPMVATVNDLRRIRATAEAARQEVNGPHLDLGVMIEVPSAVIMAPELARVADFFSIGTNDLTQYALAVDRTHPLLAERADGLHPVVLRLIDLAVKAAHAEGKWVGVCGGLATDPLAGQILTGLGVDELSVPPAAVPELKRRLRQVKLSEVRALAQRALEQEDAVAVRMLPPAASQETSTMRKAS